MAWHGHGMKQGGMEQAGMGKHGMAWTQRGMLERIPA